MRLRIQTYHPLPDVKAWFIPDVQIVPESVYDLKEALCLRFQALKARRIRGKDLILLLDDFELLNDSPFSAVRDGDLICVKLSPLAKVEDAEMEIKPGESNITRQRKRKRSQSPMLQIPGPTILPASKKKATMLSESSEESDSDSDSSSAASSSSSPSSSSSSTSSSSSSSSSTTSPSPPKPSTSQLTKQSTNSTSRIVPPGLGKPSTHSRNKRRRRKQVYEKEIMSTTLSADIPGPPKGSSHTNILPLGQRRSEPGPSNRPSDHTNLLPCDKPPSQLPSNNLDASSIYQLPQRDREGLASDAVPTLNNAFGMNAQDISDSYITPNQVMMGSLRNKNKKKGFKQSMAGPIPQKIIFTTNTAQRSSLSAQDMLVDEPSISSGTIQPRLIPPSEIQELGQLPSNMFVTSVDVESELWNEHPPSPKKKGRKKKALNGGRYPATTDWQDSSQIDADDGSITLPYFDTDIQTTTTEVSSAGTAPGSLRPFDWDRAERLWNECKVLETMEQLMFGSLVGWKGLAINPQTFSPEILLMVARVVEIRQGSANSTQTIGIRYLRRPGTGRAALAFGLSGSAEFNDEEMEEDQETFECTDFLAKQWRLIQQ